MADLDVCIYHKGCDDGFAAAYAVWKIYGDSVQYHGGEYGRPFPLVAGKDVAIVDFSYKRPVMVDLASQAKSVLVLDHHKTAAGDLEGLDRECHNVEVHFDMSRSGAMMTWQYFFPGTLVPKFFEYIQDRDLWTKQLPGVDEFTAALRSYPQKFDVWDKLIGHVPELIHDGQAIQRYYRTLVDQHKQFAYRRNINGYNVPVINASLFMSSELAGELAEGEPFAAVYVESEHFTTWSLRSRAPDGVDVSEIAKAMGGGGHKHAAGFKVERV